MIIDKIKDMFMENNWKTYITENGYVYASSKNLVLRLEESKNNVDLKRTIKGYLLPLERGKVWLYKYTNLYQPRTAKVLLQGSELFVFEEEVDWEGWDNNFYLLQELNNQYLSLGKSLEGANPYDQDYTPGYHNYPTALPKEIFMAYYYHFEGLHPLVDKEILGGGRESRLPISVQDWLCMEDYLRSIDSFKKYKPWIEKHFPGKMHNDAYMLAGTDMLWGENLSVFLDTRLDKKKKDGDVFFVKIIIDDKVIYHIKDGDVENMRILSDYVEAIDRYCEHTLLGRETRFDFLPYTSKFISPANLYSPGVYEITQEEISWYKSADWTDADKVRWDKFAPNREKFDYPVP